MCSIALALTIGSTVIGAAGQMQQASAQAAASKYNAKVAEMNAKLADRRARDALDRGAKEEQLQRMKTAAVAGKQRAAMAANGVDLGFGSPLDALVDTAKMGELDALTVRRNAANEAYDFKTQQSNFRSQAVLDRMNAKAARTGGFIGALGTVLGGASNAYSSYKQSTIGVIS